MTRDEFVRMDRELSARLRVTGTIEDRERLVMENLRRKEAIVADEQFNVIPFKQ
jgi:hypothetical protein